MPPAPFSNNNNGETQLAGFVPPPASRGFRPANNGETQLTGFVPPSASHGFRPANNGETQLTGFVPPSASHVFRPAPANNGETQLAGGVPQPSRRIQPSADDDEQTQVDGGLPTKPGSTTPPPTSGSGGGYRPPTQPVNNPAAPPQDKPQQAPQQVPAATGSATCPVGWVIVSKGASQGTSLELRKGDNFIALTAQGSLQNAAALAAGCKLIISYTDNAFYAAVPTPQNTKPDWSIELKAGAALRVDAGTELRFIPCCSGNFRWE